jgi:hypothetical protein
MGGTEVTALDPVTLARETTEIEDNYVLITDGRCHVTHTQVTQAKDGTQTHVITVKGCRPRRAS